MKTNSITSMTYSLRNRLAFRILVYLFTHGFINKAQLPSNLIMMITEWSLMKSGRPKHKTLSEKLITLLRTIPDSQSDLLCPETTISNIELYGERLLIAGYIVIYPVDSENTWSYKRTILGDRLIQNTTSLESHKIGCIDALYHD